MATELFERLVYKLHEAELLIGAPGHPRDSSRYCPPCRTRVEYLMPVIEDHVREEVREEVEFRDD